MNEPLQSSALIGIREVTNLMKLQCFFYVVFVRRQISTGDLVNQRVCLRASFLLPHVFHPKLPYELKNVHAEYAICLLY